MKDQYLNYPDLSWSLFEICNSNPTDSFEEMSRSLFYYEFLKETNVPHSDHNHPGIEVEPILEPLRDDQSVRRRVSFQSKYFKERISYSQIKHSIQITIQKYVGKLDHLYLFCNRTITKTSSQYVEIEQLLQSNGITLQPISNKDVFLLVRKYSDVAQYFFVARGVTYGYPNTGISTMIPIKTSIASISDFENSGKGKEALTKELILEKIADCRRTILEMRLKQAKSSINHILEYDINNVEDALILYYYRYLIDIFDNTPTVPEKLPAKFKTEAEWIRDFFEAPYEVQAQELRRHYPETQVFAIEKLFIEKKWDYIITLYKNTDENTFLTEVYAQLRFHVGLSYYNLHDTCNACLILDSLVDVYHDKKYKFFSTCAHIAQINQEYRECQRGKTDDLIILLQELDGLSNCDQYINNELMIATLSLEAYYNLSLSDNKYLDVVLSKQKSYSEETRNNFFVKYYTALCLEAECMFDEAIKIYASLEWKNDELVASRYIFCLIQREDYKTIKRIYSEISPAAKTEKVIGTYLHALDKSQDADYIPHLKKAIRDFNDSIEALFPIAFYTFNKDAFIDYVLPAINRRFNDISLDETPFYIKVGLLLKYSRFELFKSMNTLIEGIHDLHRIDPYIVHEIYKSFATFANKEFNKHNKAFSADESLNWIDSMSTLFLNHGLMTKQFLTVRYFCAGAWQKPYSMLKFAKELYDIDPQLWIARSIVAILAEQGEKQPEAYSPYINGLQESHVPDHCLVVSYALRRQGQNEIADYYIYKALYYLNGEDDFDIFRNCLSFAMFNIARGIPAEETNTVREKTIAVLKNNKTEDILTICIDSESEFCDKNNHSLNAVHINSEQWEYTKLLGKKAQHQLRLRQEEYTIISIQSRRDFVFHYIFKKLQENPDKFKGVAWVVSINDKEDFISQLKALTDRKDHIKTLIDSYDFKDNSLGLPIDAFISGDYSRYIDAMRMLLFVKDLIFHAGQPVLDNFGAGDKFIPSIATLVLVSQMGWLNYLEPIATDIIIPESYGTFFRERYSQACTAQNVSPGTMYFQDDQVILVEQDKTLPDIWESILEFCEKCSYSQVSTEERINLMFGPDLSGEKLMSGFKLDVAQLDAINLAKRENAIYICDDLFFRKLASSAQVRNINFVSVLLHYKNAVLYPTLNALAKTNYFLVPFLTCSDEEATQRYKDNMNGERKEKYYGQYFLNLSRLIRSLFYSDSEDDECER